MSIKVSVIVPVYNMGYYLGKCLDSLVNQTLNEFEVVIVNDGSTDNSEEIALEYQKKYPNILKYIKVENNGVANARNVGTQLASGEYIGFCDSDDYYDLDTFEVVYKKAKETNADIVAYGYYSEEEDGSYVEKGLGNMEHYGKSMLENPELLLKTNPFVHGKIFSKKFLEESKVVHVKHRVFQDLLFSYSAMLMAKKIEKVDRSFYHYIRRENVSNTGKMNMKFVVLFDVMRDLKKFYHDHGHTEFDSYLTYIACRHAYIRFTMKTDKETRKVKKEFIRRTYEFLDSYDANWRKNQYFVDTHKKSFIYRSIWYWMLHPTLAKIKHTIKKK